MPLLNKVQMYWGGGGGDTSNIRKRKHLTAFFRKPYASSNLAKILFPKQNNNLNHVNSPLRAK